MTTEGNKFKSYDDFHNLLYKKPSNFINLEKKEEPKEISQLASELK